MKKTDDINALLGKSLKLFEKFHNSTKIKKLPKKVDSSEWPKEWKTVYYKGYERFDEFILPKPVLPKRISFKDVLVNRKSERGFSSQPLSLEKLSTLLYYGAGMKKQHEIDEKRFYPSAGSRYPLEVYILSTNVSEVVSGVYHYYLKEHSLEELVLFKRNSNFKELFSQEWVHKAAITIVITAVPRRSTMKYEDRGYRHILAEAGHLAQNLYLISSALNLACCAIGGYVDNNIHELLDIDGVNESVVYVLAVGEKKT